MGSDSEHGPEHQDKAAWWRWDSTSEAGNRRVTGTTGMGADAHARFGWASAKVKVSLTFGQQGGVSIEMRNA
jgi:hypothetical protein